MKLNLHHVGIVVGNITEAADLYARHFGYKPTSAIIHDPTQTAYVQFLGRDEDRVRLELVSPDGPKSKLTNALNKGGGLHHLCFSTDDIEAECARLRAEGLLLVRPPVAAVAFAGRRIAWLIGKDRVLIELVERGHENAF